MTVTRMSGSNCTLDPTDEADARKRARAESCRQARELRWIKDRRGLAEHHRHVVQRWAALTDEERAEIEALVTLPAEDTP